MFAEGNATLCAPHPPPLKLRSTGTRCRLILYPTKLLPRLQYLTMGTPTEMKWELGIKTCGLQGFYLTKVKLSNGLKAEFFCNSPFVLSLSKYTNLFLNVFVYFDKLSTNGIRILTWSSERSVHCWAWRSISTNGIKIITWSSEPFDKLRINSAFTAAKSDDFVRRSF